MATTQDLLSILENLQGKNEEWDTSQYRYVIYARKSTEGEERQARSLRDQVIECSRVADSRGLKLLVRPHSPIEEKQSAKEPDIRPKFRKMLDDIKQGKYEGIIAWHPFMSIPQFLSTPVVFFAGAFERLENPVAKLSFKTSQSPEFRLSLG